VRSAVYAIILTLFCAAATSASAAVEGVNATTVEYQTVL